MITVIKANGEREPFSEEKVLGSIARAGVPEDLRRVVLEHVKEKLVDTITTTIVKPDIV
jgi:transcriptional regulator NrdR family protein